MSKAVIERVEMLNATSPGHVVRVEKAKYDAMKEALLASVPQAAPGLTVAEIKERVLPLLPDADYRPALVLDGLARWAVHHGACDR